MNKLSVTCPEGHRLAVNSDLSGKSVRCPRCSKKFVVPNVDTKPAVNTTLLLPKRPSAKRATQTDTRAKQPQTAKWILPVAIGAGSLVLLGIIAGVVWLLMGSRNTDSSTSAAIGEDASSSTMHSDTSSKQSSDEREQAFPRLPGAQRELPDFIIKEAPFETSAYAVVIPWEENAAPLYLEALAELEGQMSSCFPENRKEKIETVGKERGKRYYDFLSKWDHDIARFRMERTSQDITELDGILKEYEFAFQKLAAAQAKSHCCFETGIGVSTMLPHVQASRQAARVLELKLVQEVDRGEMDEAIDTFAACLRLSRDIQPRGTHVTQLVFVAINSTALDQMIGVILSNSACTTEHCQRLYNIVQSHERDSLEPISTAIMGEYAMARITLDQVQYRTGDFAPGKISQVLNDFGFEFIGDTPGHLLGLFENNFNQPHPSRVQSINTRLDLASPAEYAEEAVLIAEWATQALALRDLSSGERKEVFANLSFKGTILPKQLVNSLEFNTFVRHDARINGTLCLIALKQWLLEHNGPTTDLKDIVNRVGLSEIPVDPFSMQPLKLTMIDGAPVVYSVGDDGRDDLAKIDSENGSRPGDIIFQFEK